MDMRPWMIVLLVIMAVVLVALVVLAIYGRKLQRKQEAKDPQGAGRKSLSKYLALFKQTWEVSKPRGYTL